MVPEFTQPKVAIPKWLRLSYELGVRSLRFSAVALSPIMASESGVSRDSRPMNRWNLGCRALLELAALGVMGT